MKSLTFLLILLSIPYIAICQTPTSEIIKHVSYTQLKGDKLIQEDTVVLQINERMGDHDAEINIVYSKGDKISIGDAWIEDMSGNIIRKLKNKDIKDQSYISDMSLYEDDYTKSFELKHNVYPYRIVYSYKGIFSKYINVAGVNCINKRLSVKNGKIVLETTLDRPIKWKQENTDPPLIDTVENIIKYTWNYSYTSNPRERNSLVNSFNAPLITVIPLTYKYGIQGSTESWQSFGNWIFRLNKDRDKLTEAEQGKIKNLISSANNDIDKVKILYKYLQDYTRYINVSINIGGLQTYPASYVCTNKYGDCKALTNYMLSMLKFIGIKSYYTLIQAGDKVIDIDEAFPSQAFNHVILTVPLANDTIFLECTSKNTPFGYMGTFTQGRKALLVDENNSHLINIPPLTTEKVLCNRNFKVNMMTSDVKLKVEERGYNYEHSLYLTSEVNKNIVDKYIRNNILSGSYDLSDFKFIVEDRDSSKITLNADCKVHNLYKEYGKNLVITPFPIEITSYESPDKRVSGVQLDYPEFYKDGAVYSFSDKDLTKAPDNIEIISKYGRYDVMYEIKDRQLFVYKSILIYSRKYPVDEYVDFYKFISAIKNNEIKKIYLETL
ncbi:MAG: DUF3857 and transglutaminase domain-containing protein [Prevotella sp.]|jgi:hypothetical protein|nr:DUF3857 and transglutaminase domain-containing protein [Prevotella sp.]